MALQFYRISILGPSQKLRSSSVMRAEENVIMWHQDDVSLCPGSGIFKTFAGNMLFCAIIGTWKREHFETISPNFSSNKMFLCNNSDQTCFSDTLTSAGLLSSGFNTSLRAQQMLMHRKPCPIPILLLGPKFQLSCRLLRFSRQVWVLPGLTTPKAAFLMTWGS